MQLPEPNATFWIRQAPNVCARHERQLGGPEVKILDVPGIGDQDIPPSELVKMCEEKLKGEKVQYVLLFMGTDTPRFDLTAQILIILRDIYFSNLGPTKYEMDQFDGIGIEIWIEPFE